VSSYLSLFRRTMLAASLGALLSAPVLAEESDYGRLTATAITDRIALKDCAGAVADLKAGLKNGFAEVALLAGSMYEHGACVQRDWNRAVPFYVQAWQGGMVEAADRLAAGYAAPGNGLDVAAALWWASRGRGHEVQAHGLQQCAVSPAASDDIDRFVAELQTWHPSRLTACNYMTGVMSTISAEVKYPAAGIIYRANGNVILRFLPAVPRIEMQKGGKGEFQLLGWVEEDLTQDRARTRLAGFDKAVSDVANRALRRYPHPDGIPADTAITVQYVFETR
jgi:hypothetical protein